MQGNGIWVALALAGTTMAAACGGGSSAPPPSPAAAPPTAAIDAATAATITGRVVVNGNVPKPEPIAMTADPVCASSAAGAVTETFVVGPDNGLENVFVYVKSGLGTRTFAVPTSPVVLNQQGCHYTPHVLGIQVGQPLDILNSDDTLHNIHAVAQVNEEFNIGQPIKGMKTTRTFDKREVMIPFKCDVHGWMNAYVGVLEHPYFAVTAGGGKFAIKTLPPGTYEIDAWHEKLGTQTQTVTVGEKETKEITFTFTAG